MFPRNIPLFKLDFTGKRKENLVEGEYYRKLNTTDYTEDMDDFKDTIFIPRCGPFYTESLVLTKPNGEVLVEGKHYEIFGIASALTAFIKDKEVAIFVSIVDEEINEWFAKYQVVGHFSILNRDLVDLVNTAVNDERPVYYKNIRHKPKWFNPEKHKHDIRYDIVSLKDLVDGIKSIRSYNKKLPSRGSIAVEHFNKVIFDRINDFERMLLEYIRKHDSENVFPYGNSHGLTAEQLKLGNVDNFETASLLDILDGFRHDKHLTVDLVKRALDTIGKDTDNLVRSGSLPILVYGTTSFIPTPIQGSFEGMGGNNFFVGTNIETSGEGLILMNRNDGRVNGLYFMRNDNRNGLLTSREWNFTAYRYEHQTATTEKVSLTDIIRGSNGKFLIVGGKDASDKQVWYYSLGNGTFDPLRHKLIRMPEQIKVKATDSLITEAYPKRIFIVSRTTSSEVANNTADRGVIMDLPNPTGGFSGVSFNSDFYGFIIWEYTISESKWRKVVFNYNQVDDTKQITYPIYSPFKLVVKAVSEEYPRADMHTTGYGISQFEYKFTKMLKAWNMRAWHDQVVALYDEETDNLYCKYVYTAVGEDDRAGTHEGGTNSIGFILKNRKVSTTAGVDEVYYDVENRKSLTQLYTIDTTTFGGSNKNVIDGPSAPHSEWVMAGYNGGRTNGWFSTKRWFSIGSAAYGSFPILITMRNFNGLGNVENFDNFVNDRLSENLGGVTIVQNDYSYNEINPAGLSIGGHSTFWLQLNPNDPNSYGSVSLINNENIPNPTGLVFRKQPALDSRGYALPPDNSYNLYPELKNGEIATLGYDLNNEIAYITNPYIETFVTNIFNDAPNNRRSEYIKHLKGHQSYTGNTITTVNNSNANTIFEAEHEIVAEGINYTINATKWYEMRDIITNVLIPYLKTNASVHETTGRTLDYVNALGTHRIGFTNLQGNKYAQLLVFSCLAFDDITAGTNAYSSSICFNLTGGAKDSDGIIQNAKATIVGKPYTTAITPVREDLFSQAIRENANFTRSVGKNVVQSRDLVMQMENGYSHVNLQWDLYLPVKANNSYPGLSLLISEDGIIDGKNFGSYWTPGEVRWFHHPYYGCIDRQNSSSDRRPNGSAEIGHPYQRVFEKMSEHTYDLSTFVLGNSNYLSSYFTINVSVTQEAMLSGKKYQLPTAILNLTDYTADPRDKTFYLYLDYGENGPYYRMVLSPLAETPSRGLISIIKTNRDSVYSIENQNVFTMNGIRISSIRHGSVIPAATGSILNNGQLEGWVTKNRS